MRRLVALILFLLTALAVGCGSQLAAAGPIGTFSRGYSGVAAPGYVYDVALKQSIQTVGIAEDSPPPAPPPTSTRGGALPRIHFHAVAAEAGDGAGIGATTAHGAERVAGAAATRGGVLSPEQILNVRGSGEVWSQADGATVRILQNGAGRYDVVVDGDRGLITTFSNLSQKSFDRLAGNYGWTP